MSTAHVTFRALFFVAAPPFLLSEVMPEQFVPATSVRALCKTVFGDQVAKNVHGDHWKTAVVQGFILQHPLGGKKVLVECLHMKSSCLHMKSALILKNLLF